MMPTRPSALALQDSADARQRRARLDPAQKMIGAGPKPARPCVTASAFSGGRQSVDDYASELIGADLRLVTPAVRREDPFDRSLWI